MSIEKKKCCKDCKSGNEGQNEDCKAKLLVAQLRKQQEMRAQEVAEV